MQSKVEQVILSSYESMYRLAYSYVRNEQDAMDVVQESAYKCIAHAAEIRQEQYIKTWVWRIVMNTALEWKKRLQREVATDQWKEEAKEAMYTNLDVQKALHSLDEREQMIITLYYYEGFKLEEVSQIMEMNLSTLKSKLYRSLKKMKQYVE